MKRALKIAIWADLVILSIALWVWIIHHPLASAVVIVAAFNLVEAIDFARGPRRDRKCN